MTSDTFRRTLVLALPVALSAPAIAGSACDFEPDVTYGVGEWPDHVAVGDLNGDDAPDIVSANWFSNNVSVLLNLGDGTFADDVLYPSGGWPLGVAIGDLNGDDAPDIVSANADTDDLSIFFNNGDGTFAEDVRLDAGDDPFRVAIGDLDGDDDLDLAVANHASSNVSVLLNNGDGTFEPPQHYPANAGTNELALGDLDDDDDLDIATANEFGTVNGNASVLLNNGDGTFAAADQYETGDFCSDIAAGDLDGDDDLDLVIINTLTGDLSMLLNIGDGTFAPEIRIPVGQLPYGIAIADLDDDDDLDIALTDYGNVIKVLLNDGAGTFAAPVPFDVGQNPRAIAVGDLDGDADPDLVVANTSSDSVSVLINITGEIQCPPDAVVEGEPICGPDHDDLFNPGCLTDPPIYSAIECSDLVCGTSGTYVHSGFDYRDTDWYLVELPEIGLVSWAAVAEYPILLAIYPGADECEISAFDFVTGNAHEPVEVTATTSASTFRVWTAPAIFTGVPCGATYLAQVACHSAPPCPADLDGNGVVNVSDLLALLGAWGQSGVPADLDGSGAVDVADLLMLLAAWGDCA
jgi:hypothetical protein